MKLWIDDATPAPVGYSVWLRSVEESRLYIGVNEKIKELEKIELIDIDTDAGEYIVDGGNYIKLLTWLEETGRNYPIRLHTQDIDAITKMREIIKRNGWREII